MKQYLTIFALCAIVVGLIYVCTGPEEEAYFSDSDYGEPVTLAKSILGEEWFNSDFDSLSITPLPKLRSEFSTEQGAVLNTSFFSPLPSLEPAGQNGRVASHASHASTDEPFLDVESVLANKAEPAESYDLFADDDTDQDDQVGSHPKADDLTDDQSSPSDRVLEQELEQEQELGQSQGLAESSEEDLDQLNEDDYSDDYADEDLDETDDQFETDVDDAANEPPRVPDETEQIGLLLAQIANQRLTGAANELRWSLDDALMAALAYSNRVSSLRIESTEALQNVGIEYGEFDVAAFVTQSFRDSAEPVGSSIDTASGAQAIVDEEDINVAYGLRRQLRTGGDFEISQSYQILDNDSGILVPEDQAIARLNGRLTKELLRGAGRSIAMNQVLVAQHDAFAQRSESVAAIADHLNEVMTAYWDIFAARGALLASIENRQLAIKVRTELNARKDIDAEANLLAQSEATIRQRELQINQAHSDLVQAQIEFISLVNAPELLDNSNNLEILPQVAPDLNFRELDVASRVNTAIQRRPEIGDIIQQIKSAQVSNHLSLNELLPRLSLSLDASLNGLEGDRQLGAAINNQFDNDLTYQVGADFEVPLANRRARFNKRRTELVVARLRADWQGLIQEVKADVLDNAQEFSATQQRLQTQREVLKFTASELRYLGLRKTIAPKETDNVSFALTQVLSAQDRQNEAKSDFIAAIADKHRAIFELNRATGILVNSDVIPEDGVLIRPGFFTVYHQFIEDKAVLEGPLNYVESTTRAKSKLFNAQYGVGRLNLGRCSCKSGATGPCTCQPTHSNAVQPVIGQSHEVIQAGAEFPAAESFRYPLR